MQARAAIGIAFAFCAASIAGAVAAPTPLAMPKDVGLQDVGEGVAIALPLIAGGISIYKDDWNGAGQLALVTGATVGTTYLLNRFVKEERPYCKGEVGCDDHSFPSNTSALAFAPAQYLWNRYGWEYGVPAYAAAGFVGATRVVAGEHRVWDVATSGVISFVYNWIVTDRYRAPDNIYSGVYATPKGAVFALNYRW
ncbi:MAG TPA: phosphatase PAP2 family protein [Rhizomicrobium sp.]